jgi:Spy/CpxP family protein refolding chaperone
MRTKTTPVLVMIVAIPLLAAGCSPDEQDAALAAPLKAQGTLGHAKVLKELMGKLSLRADQRASIEQLAKEVHAKMAPARELRAEVVKEVAGQLRAGRVDRAKIDALVKRARAQHRAAKPVLIAALNRLHRTLDASQRAELVEELEDRFDRRPRHHRKMRKLMKRLKLSDDQKDRIKSYARSTFRASRTERIAKLMKLKDQIEDAADAFKSDRFDAAKLAIFQRSPDQHRPKVKLMIRMAELTLPILTAEQRNLAATLIEEHAKLHGARWSR